MGKQLIRIDDAAFEALAARMTDRGKAAAEEVVGEDIAALTARTRAHWPVDSGESASSFFADVRVDLNEVAGEMRNDSGYAHFVNRGRTYQALVIEPFRELVRELPDRIAAQITRD